MLSYQHGYHAGNAADVTKHAVLALLLAEAKLGANPTYLESHAGRGLYPLNSPEAVKLNEHDTGLVPLLQAQQNSPETVPPELRRWVEQVSHAFYANNPIYPGSPMVAAGFLPPQATLHLAELHPQEIKHLRQSSKTDRRIVIHAEDGHAMVLKNLPDPKTPAVILLDPSYEQKFEYAQTAETAEAILQKHPKAIILIWYPLLRVGRHQGLVSRIAALKHERQKHKPWQLEVTWKNEGYGLIGTGLLALNAPASFTQNAALALEWLAQAIGGQLRHRHL